MFGMVLFGFKRDIDTVSKWKRVHPALSPRSEERLQVRAAFKSSAG
jgi:hypothetical protein